MRDGKLLAESEPNALIDSYNMTVSSSSGGANFTRNLSYIDPLTLDLLGPC